jgi:hypothetical protein
MSRKWSERFLSATAATLVAAGNPDVVGIVSTQASILVPLKGALKAMLIAKHKFAAAVTLTAGLMLGATGLGFAQAPADKPAAKAVDPLSDEQFAKTLALIKPQPGESKWSEIPWLLSVHDARVKAAAEGKPIFIWSAGGALPIGTC